MNYLISSTTFIGLETTSSGFKGASITPKRNTLPSVRLFTFHLETDDVKQLYINNPVIVTGIGGKELLLRSMHLSLTKKNDIVEALPFQSEPLLPYPTDVAVLTYQMISQTEEGSDITLLSARKEDIAEHLHSWQTLGIDPEKIASTPTALAEFGSLFLPDIKTYLLLHIQPHDFTAVLIKEGKLCASYTICEGTQLLLEAQKKEGLYDLPQTIEDWKAIAHGMGALTSAIKKLQREAAKMVFALAKECKSGAIEGVIITGNGAEWNGLSAIAFVPPCRSDT